jgi:hypothetical protein
LCAHDRRGSHAGDPEFTTLNSRPETPPASSQAAPQEPGEFSLVGGGPLYELWRRTRLSGDGLERTSRRVLATVALAWVPLLLLSIAEGRAWGGGVTPSFLQDIETQVRLLVSVPFLILAEVTVHRQMTPIVRRFLEYGLIPDSERWRLDAAIASATRLRNSMAAELLLVALVYGVGMLVIRRTQFMLEVDTWYASVVGGRQQLTYAGWWGALVSMPLVQFLVVRWYFRFFVWARFLWQVSRIDLDLKPAHPDGAAGLGFIALTERACRPVLLGIGAMLSGMIANRIFYAGATLPEFKVELIGMVALLIFTILGPMLVFTPKLVDARHRGILEYGRLGRRYAIEFERKWLRGERPADEPLLGSADIQSLADLRSAFEVVKGMRVVPFDLRNMIALAVVTLIPVIPLLLATFSVEELLNRLLKAVF